MITSLVRGALRFIAAVALFVLGALTVSAAIGGGAPAPVPTTTQAITLPPQTYTVPSDVVAAPIQTFDVPRVVVPKPKPTATKPQAAPPRKSSEANVRPAVPAFSISAAQSYARSRLSATQYACLANIATRESGWNVHAENSSSGAYGIPQALPGSKMASAGSDWQNNYKTQINWMIGYVNARYGSACGAWSYWQAHSNY